jgi:glycopeptide antibiotics resistance protein
VKLARIVAWLAVVAIVVWLLSLTLRVSSELSFGRVRFRDPSSELNLRPFSNKLRPLRNLESPSAALRRSARTYLFVDVLGNVTVFVPFGAALATAAYLTWPARRRWWRIPLRVTGIGLLLSLLIEITQLAIPSRVTDIDDVMLNTLGTAVGALLMWLVMLPFQVKRD